MAKIELRRVTEEDKWLLYEWANDSAARENAIHTHKIAREEHDKWFAAKMNDTECHIYIYMVDGIPVGQVRVDIDGFVGEVDYYIKPGFRGLGHAKHMLNMMEQLEVDKLEKIVARVKITNIASQHALISAGYDSDELVTYNKMLLHNESYSIFDDKVLCETDETEKIRGGVLFLTNNSNTSELIAYLRRVESNVYVISEPITVEDINSLQPSFIVSYNYNYLIRQNVISLMPDRIINMHISMLPWNKGMDPNVWSFIENSPKGVTIHRLTEKLDDGEILLQQSVSFDETKETLASSYDKLQNMIQTLFIQNWEGLKNNTVCGYFNRSGGSFHRAKEFIAIKSEIEDFNWNMRICDFKNKVKQRYQQ